jgi:serine/threonine protein kinase
MMKMVSPATPFVQIPDISALYEIFDEEKGKGRTSHVVVARQISTGTLRAIKVIDKSTAGCKAVEVSIREKEILRRTNNKNILFLHETLESNGKLYLVLDLMECDLLTYVSQRGSLSEANAAIIMKQLIEAVSYLHRECIVHRDIKLENILISTLNNIKLADFGFAKILMTWDVKSTPVGTPNYVAPEIIRGIEENGFVPLCSNRDEIKLVDMWSCGVVMYSLLAGRCPFKALTATSDGRRWTLKLMNRRNVLFAGDFWKSVSDEAKDLILSLLEVDVSRRVSACKALQHPFFKLHDCAGGPETPPSLSRLSQEELQEIRDDCDAMQKELVEAGDADGDATAYPGVVAVKAPPRPTPKFDMSIIGKRQTASPLAGTACEDSTV